MTGTENGSGNGNAAGPNVDSMNLGELKTAYADRFGKAPKFADKRKLIRILSAKASELAVTIASTPPAPKTDEPIKAKKPRSRGRARAQVASQAPTIIGPKSGKLPSLAPGTKLVRLYRGKRVIVTCLDGGRFEYENRTFRSLSAIANLVSQTHTNGLAWFGLRKRAKKARPS